MTAAIQTEEIPSRREAKRARFYLNDDLRVAIGDLRGHVLDLGPNSIGAAFSEVLSEGLHEIRVESRGSVVSDKILCRVRSQGPMRVQGKVFNRYVIIWYQQYFNVSNDCMMLPEVYQPQGYCQHPFMMDEMICFRVLGFQKNGCVVSTSIRNKGLFVGTELNVKILLPFSGEHSIKSRIKRIFSAEGAFFVELRFDEADHQFFAFYSEYLINFCESGPDVRHLEGAGYFVNSTKHAVRIKAVEDTAEWQQILQIRFKAYKAAGKFSSANSHVDMEDAFDKFSRQFAVVVNGTIVGAFRIVFVNGDLVRSEHASLNIPVPDFLQKGGFAEVSRICVNPEFQGQDIFFSILRVVSLTLVTEPTINFILANCNPKEWVVYRSIGAKKLGKPFEGFGKKDCQLIYVDIKKAIRGQMLNPRISDLTLFATIVAPVADLLQIRLWGLPKVFSNAIMSFLRRVLHQRFFQAKLRKYERRRSQESNSSGENDESKNRAA